MPYQSEEWWSHPERTRCLVPQSLLVKSGNRKLRGEHMPLRDIVALVYVTVRGGMHGGVVRR